MNRREKLFKRTFDIVLAFFSLLIFIVPIIILALLAILDCGKNGIFLQTRIGLRGKPFTIYKIRTMKPTGAVSRYSKFIRRSKIDELPQLFNILIGSMSFVGPRPDLSGYLDKVEGENKMLLNHKPGLTSPASLLFFEEEQLLAKQNDPKAYYDSTVWPQKVIINMRYFEKFSFKKDLELILNTIWYSLFRKELFSFKKY